MKSAAIFILIHCCLPEESSAFQIAGRLRFSAPIRKPSSSLCGSSFRWHISNHAANHRYRHGLTQANSAMDPLFGGSIYTLFEFIGKKLPTAFFKELGVIDDHPLLLAIYFLSNLAFPAAGVRMLTVRGRPNRRLGSLIILVGFISAAFHWYVTFRSQCSSTPLVTASEQASVFSRKRKPHCSYLVSHRHHLFCFSGNNVRHLQVVLRSWNLIGDRMALLPFISGARAHTHKHTQN